MVHMAFARQLTSHRIHRTQERQTSRILETTVQSMLQLNVNITDFGEALIYSG